MFGLRTPELLIILAVLVLLFGATRLPQLGEALGKGIRSFKRATEHGFGDDEETASPPQRKLDAPATTQRAAADTEKVDRKSTPSS
ncbi:MAG: twin-arginine translocase TatA/TatE family subunit [Myxococcales bacterium]